jgi:hypothetical protein
MIFFRVRPPGVLIILIERNLSHRAWEGDRQFA